MTCFTDVTIVSAGFSGYFLLFVTLGPSFHTHDIYIGNKIVHIQQSVTSTPWIWPYTSWEKDS